MCGKANVGSLAEKRLTTVTIVPTISKDNRCVYQIRYEHPHHVGMDYAPFKIPSRMAGDFSYHSVIPPSPQKVTLHLRCSLAAT